MQEPRIYNVKALFVDGKLDRFIIGDFGRVGVDRSKAQEITPEHNTNTDQLISCPYDPETIGPFSLAEAIGAKQITDSFWQNPKFQYEQ